MRPVRAPPRGRHPRMATVLAVAATCVACAAAPARANPPPAPDRLYAGLAGTVLLDNPWVHVERFVLAPGQSTGARAGGANRLVVFIHGGTLRSNADGRATVWHDGRVAWHPAIEAGDAGVTNAGTTPVDFEWVTVKPTAPADTVAPPAYHYLNYPNIPGEDVLDNERVIVQRFVVQPGQWEGVHAHHPGMLYIHVRGGQWAARSKQEPEHTYPDASPDGSVGWMDTIPLSAGHESGNVGDRPIDLIWITLKH